MIQKNASTQPIRASKTYPPAHTAMNPASSKSGSKSRVTKRRATPKKDVRIAMPKPQKGGPNGPPQSFNAIEVTTNRAFCADPCKPKAPIQDPRPHPPAARAVSSPLSPPQ